MQIMDNEALAATKKCDLSKLKQLLNQDLDIDAQDANGRTLLHHAASHGQREAVECLLQKGVNVLLTTDKGNTVLHIAVIKNDEALVKAILENVSRDKLKKLLDATTKATGTAALHVATKQNSHANVSILLEYGANFEIRNKAGEKPVDLANSGKLQELFQLIDTSFQQAKNRDDKLTEINVEQATPFAKPVGNCRNNKGHTILQVLVLHGNEAYKLADKFSNLRAIQAIEHEIYVFGTRRLDPNGKDDEADELAKRVREYKQFWSKRYIDLLTDGPDMCMEHRGKSICVGLVKAHEVLLAYRKVEGKDRSLTANAAMKSLEEVLEVLGFDPERKYAVATKEDWYYNNLPVKWKKDSCSFMLLMNGVINVSIEYLLQWLSVIRIFRAVKVNDVAKVQHLLDCKTHTNIDDPRGRTVLCYAAENGYKKIVKLLLKSGMKVTHRCGTLSPLHLAVSNGHAKIVKLLLEKTDVKCIDCRPENGCTALHAAAMIGSMYIVKMLLKYGASYQVLNEDGRTPLHLSTSEDVSELLRLVYDCFRDAKEANDDLVHKLKAMSTDMFLAIVGTKNRNGQTLAVVAAKAGAKSIAGMILRMIREVKGDEKLFCARQKFTL